SFCLIYFLSCLLLLFLSFLSVITFKAPVNISVTQLRAHSAMVTWNIPQGDTVIGYSISQQRQDGLMQRSIREVNTSSRWCVLWDLDEDTHYSVQVQSVGLHGDSQPSRAVHFRTLERSDHYPAGVSLDVCVCVCVCLLSAGVNKCVCYAVAVLTVLLSTPAVIALFCRQYDIIKDNDSNGTKEKAKSSPIYHNGAVRSSRVTHFSSNH
uniref:Fibronectin type III domain-containing protein 4-like n=1 Tax=Mastacembelus armatus TaxID=205130 RepID=A0A7N8Y0Z7_9TELE